MLIRHIATVREVGESSRRDAESHRLQLLEPDEVLASLGRAGFDAQRIGAYRAESLPLGLVGFLGRKPRENRRVKASRELP